MSCIRLRALMELESEETAERDMARSRLKGKEKGTESDSGAGIGSGSAGIGGGMITIAGGSVYAAASVGAGIGGGYKGTSGSIVISGGDVEARGGEYNRSVKAVAIGPETVDGTNNSFTLKARKSNGRIPWS